MPVQFEGSRITLFWAAEAVLLLWFSQRTAAQCIERSLQATPEALPCLLYTSRCV